MVEQPLVDHGGEAVQTQARKHGRAEGAPLALLKAVGQRDEDDAAACKAVWSGWWLRQPRKWLGQPRKWLGHPDGVLGCVGGQVSLRVERFRAGGW